ncbi:hypothetical protein RI129_011543 [Pyrocoelia pectoralis]|uniref:BZIP domain-containing protein n=1 Tax=Pyrocoelia pectoralis TaxID=417401 RepID=A0AAN7ZFZ7_9COLE
MIALKKVYRSDWLQFALLLSLLRVNPDSYLEGDLFNNISDLDFDNGTSWRLFATGPLRTHYIHPKNLDSALLHYERELFEDLNSLGQYNPLNTFYRHQNVTAYLLSVNRSTALNADATSNTNDQHILDQPLSQTPVELSPLVGEDDPPTLFDDLGLTQEDMDLIEVLWKQDVDLGFSLQTSESTISAKPDAGYQQNSSSPATSTIDEDEIEKLKTLKAVNQETIKEEVDANVEPEPWSDLNYTIDTETGEYVIKTELERPLSVESVEPTCDLSLGDLSLPLPEFLLEEALQLVGLDDEIPQEGVNIRNISLAPEPNFLPSSQENDTTGSSLVSLPEASPAGPVGTDTDTNAVLENSTANLIKDLEADEDFNIFPEMIQTPQFHHSHHRAFQSRMPIVRAVSMEQRWQDLASLLSLQNASEATAMPHPFSHHPLHNYSHPHSHSMGYGPDARGVLLHNATLTPPMGDLNASTPYSNMGGTNLGNAVATSMNLTNSSEPMDGPNPGTHYKVEPTHDMMYYQNGSSEMNQSDGFLSSILNDEDLQLMDMAMNEGMYTMRMLDSNNALSNLSISGAPNSTISQVEVERIDASSDSAVSSMGSERVPSLSDGEWCDAGSDSGHTTGDPYVVDYHSTSKYRPYDYSYASRQHGNTLGGSETVRMPQVAQKKHQMFGKRCFQEQNVPVIIGHPTHPKYFPDAPTSSSFSSPSQAEGAVGSKMPEIKYSCSMELSRHNSVGRSPISHIQHNHTYHLPVENTGAMQRPVLRDKAKSRKSEEEHLSRDEKRARALSVPITVNDIINLPMDEFNERLSKYDLSETQLSLIRDIRRRGKNKVAAQNCRKRKLDQILSLADEVKDIRDRKLRMLSEQDFILAERQRIKDKYQQLYRHVFQNLRDPDGNPYSPYQYSLQTSADGSILIVPKANNSLLNPDRKDPPHQHKE